MHMWLCVSSWFWNCRGKRVLQHFWNELRSRNPSSCLTTIIRQSFSLLHHPLSDFFFFLSEGRAAIIISNHCLSNKQVWNVLNSKQVVMFWSEEGRRLRRRRRLCSVCVRGGGRLFHYRQLNFPEHPQYCEFEGPSLLAASPINYHLFLPELQLQI